MSVKPWIPPRRSSRDDPRFKVVEMKVPSPPEIPEVVKAPLAQRLLPIFMAIAMVGMMGIFVATGLRQINPMMLMFPLMFLGSAAGMIGGNHAGSQNSAALDVERRKYMEMLTGLRDEVHDLASAQYRYLSHTAPAPQLLVTLASGPRLWERGSPEHEKFLVCRVGLARQRLSGGLRLELNAADADLEPVTTRAAKQFRRTHRAVDQMPMAIGLQTHSSLQWFGEGDVAGAIRAQLIQLAVFHPPNLLLIAVVTDHPQEWDWIKWLPHNQNPNRNDALGTERMVYSAVQARDGLLDITGGRSGFSRHAEFRGDKPWLVVVADRVGAVPGQDCEAVTVMRLAVEESSFGPYHTGPRYEVRPDEQTRRRQANADDPLKDFLAKTDMLGVDEARRAARRIARWRPAASVQVSSGQDDAGYVQKNWESLLGIDDVGTMGANPWVQFPDRDPQRMRVPIGWDGRGAPKVIDMKEESEGGMGSHGLILGGTGSGKSAFVANLMLGLVTRHTPDQVNIVAVDYKGDGTFPGFEKLHHTVQVITNLGDSVDLVSRLDDVLRGEVERRQALRREAGRFKDAAAYEKARERGKKIPPFPALIVVVDEFTALLKEHPEFRHLFEHLARQGRSDRVQLVLATQSLTGIPLGQLDSNLGWRVSLKTATAQDSQAAIGTKDAFHLEKIGQGFLRVGGAEPEFFEAAHVYEPYFPPLTSPKARGYANFASGGSVVTAFGVSRIALPEADKPDEPEQPVVIRSQEENDHAPETIKVVLDQLAGQGQQAYQMWKPPLQRPQTVAELLAASGTAPGKSSMLMVPIGIVDRPYLHSQDVFSINLESSHLALVGRTQSGKSVALQTFVMSAAKLNSPQQVQFYGLDFSDGKLASLEGLPHVGGVAVSGQTDKVRRVVAEVTALASRRAALFADLGITSMDAYRDMVAAGKCQDDGFGDVLLIIDGWDEFKRLHDPAFAGVASPQGDVMAGIERLVRQGLSRGIRVVIAVQLWTELSRRIADGISTKVEFRVNDTGVALASKKLAETVPGNIPGRAVDIATSEHVMIGAPRLDEVPEVADSATLAAIEELKQQWQDYPEAMAVRLLPARLDAQALHQPEQWSGSPWSVPLGLREKDLSTAMCDLMAERHLSIFGARDSGKTHLLAWIMRSLMSRYTPDQVKFSVVDLKSSALLDAIDERYIAVDGQGRQHLILNASDLPWMVEGLAGLMQGRAPSGAVSLEERRRRSWWSGPEVFVFIDDYGMVFNGAPQVFTPWAQDFGSARERGLHVISACPISLATRVLSMSGLMKWAADANSATLIMDGIKDNGPIAQVRVQPMLPGRGVLVTRGVQEIIQTPLMADLEQ